MLAELNSVDWSQLSHAYGPASDVPQLIEALASDHKQIRDNAFHELYSNIYHQGTVYEATSHAVPFLIELAELPFVPDRPRVLGLLASLADGHGSETIDREIATAVNRGVPLYLRLLCDADAAIRSDAAHLLVRCHDKRIVASLRKQLGIETDPCTRASILFALGDVGDREAVPLILEYVASDDLESRFAAAVALAQLAPEQMPFVAIETVAEVVLSYERTERLQTTPKNADVEMVLLAADTLTALGSKRAGFIAPKILEGLPQVKSFCAMEPTYALLGVTFAERENRIQADSLTSEQVHILTSILQMPHLWESDYTCGWPSGIFGLPEDRKGLEALLRRRRPT